MLKNKPLKLLLIRVLFFMVFMGLFYYFTTYDHNLKKSAFAALGVGVFFGLTIYFFERKHWKGNGNNTNKGISNGTLLILVSLFITGCEKDPDAIKVPTSEIPVIEGFYVTNTVGNLIGVYGIPNTLNEADGCRISTPFPNPSVGYTNVHVTLPQNFSNATLWITPAIFKGEYLNPAATNSAIFMVAGGLPIAAYKILNHDVYLPISGLSPGAYRIFMFCDNTLLYDNLIVTQNKYNQ